MPGVGTYETLTPLELQPSSARVELGNPYPVLLCTHCGVGFAVDFDGSYWQPQARGHHDTGRARPGSVRPRGGIDTFRSTQGTKGLPRTVRLTPR